jgi:hypothetical protein
MYNSVANDRCDHREVAKILETSQQLNAASNITGILYYSNRYFLQYLEGNLSDVKATYLRITRDPRHSGLSLVDESLIDDRKFAGWAMAYIPTSDSITPAISEFQTQAEFNPKAMSADNTVKFIMALQTQLPKAHYPIANNEEQPE